MKWDLSRIFKKNEKVKFFTLDEIEKVKKGVLILESSNFKIVLLNISKGIDERERELEIDERLEDEIEGYNNFDYIDKELTIFEDEDIEKVLIILIERDKIDSLIENIKEYNVELVGMYPLFFMEFFNLDNEKKSYLEIEDENTRIYKFFKNKLIDFQEIVIEKEEILNNNEYLEEYLEEDSKRIIYNNQSEIVEYLKDIEVNDWRDYGYHIETQYDYLPKEYHQERNYKKNLKLFGCISSLVIILGVINFFICNYYLEKKNAELNLVQNNYREIKENNIGLRDKIKAIEKEILEVREKRRERDFNKIELFKIFSYLLENLVGIEIYKLDYDGEKIINILGEASSEKDIYKFQKRLLEMRCFKNINQDFIKLEGDTYKFHIDIEVDYENNE